MKPKKFVVCSVLCSCGLAVSILSGCNELDDAHKRIQKVLEYQLENCNQLSTPQAQAACRDENLLNANAAHTKLEQLWIDTTNEHYETDEEFKHALIEKILEEPLGPIRDFLIDAIHQIFGGKDNETELEGNAIVNDLPHLTANEAIQTMPSNSLIGVPGPIQLVTKQLTIDSSITMIHETESFVGQIDGDITIQVGQGQSGPRQIRVLSGSLTISSSYSGLGGVPITYEIVPNGSSRMIVGSNGETVLRLDMDGSGHPFSFTYDESPTFEIPMIEDYFNHFIIDVDTEYKNLHAWNPWPVSDFNGDGSYDNWDVADYLSAFNTQESRSDLTHDGIFDGDDVQLFVEYFTEDQARSFYQSDRFNNQ